MKWKINMRNNQKALLMKCFFVKEQTLQLITDWHINKLDPKR